MTDPLAQLRQPSVRVGVCSRGMMKMPRLALLLGRLREELVPVSGRAGEEVCDLYVGWGNKPSGQLARQLAARHDRPFLLLEDAFLRSLAPQGRFGEWPLGIVLDDRGIYYDSSRPSRLEKLIATAARTPSRAQEGERLLETIRHLRVSKYNDFLHMPESLRRQLREERAVLVVDQTWRDLSVAGAGCDERDFRRMLEAAHDENPGATVVVKLHPEVLQGSKRGYLRDLAEHYHCRILTENHSPWDLLPCCKALYTVSSQMGFDALLAGVPVRCFGMPFYAGWGLTRDEKPPPDRRGRDRGVELAHVAWAALEGYARYLDPFTDAPTQAGQAMKTLALWRDVYVESARISTFYGISGWKRRRIREMFYKQGQRGIFHRSVRRAVRHAARHGGVLVAWASKAALPDLRRECERAGVELWRMEDGFIRSVGLGAELVPPMSLVLDRRGIYYDPTQPSQLEWLLQHADIPADMLRQARALRQKLVEAAITKYNLAEDALSIAVPEGRKVILVPGQVDDDASIRLGANGMTGAQHLRLVREHNPDAFIIFKPHPDVVAGQRAGLGADALARELADHVAEGQSILSLLELADEVHVLTSLTGFEALLRGRQVHCYGMPFYAGWGLTRDHATCERRTRQRSLDELVAAVLMMYSRYFDPVAGLPCGPEIVIERIRQQRANPPRPSLLTRLRIMQGRLRKRLAGARARA